ncbi:hypothetical protein [Marinifilum caeruleilacunae]|uniref:Uncharacterized protein n=1 Tax=Marinifilum caeruleilacunae TaxID=2499076 RepID=A0ABX1WQZ4_9BACT|nr:hypothetical protein [Marinifilum caeruleilacunae]NOU58513.1 hypothetical protein [Marinifilum caeruleilacunae]
MRPTIIFILLLMALQTSAKARFIHVFVALCDNEHQGIVPVPEALGNGKDPARNLYWGAAFGVKNFFHRKTNHWQLVKTIDSNDVNILERLLFKHHTEDIYLLADAYDGEHIQTCIEQFLESSNGQHPIHIKHEEKSLHFGGNSDLIAYVGHDGLMDFDVMLDYEKNENPIDVMILACYSKSYFKKEIKAAQANPLLWTTHLMAPEAYTLQSAIDGWILNESPAEIEERAAQSYHQYQKCGIRGARNLFTSGY